MNQFYFNIKLNRISSGFKEILIVGWNDLSVGNICFNDCNEFKASSAVV